MLHCDYSYYIYIYIFKHLNAKLNSKKIQIKSLQNFGKLYWIKTKLIISYLLEHLCF